MFCVSSLSCNVVDSSAACDCGISSLELRIKMVCNVKLLMFAQALVILRSNVGQYKSWLGYGIVNVCYWF